jgi:hypothetical protein
MSNIANNNLKQDSKEIISKIKKGFEEIFDDINKLDYIQGKLNSNLLNKDIYKIYKSKEEFHLYLSSNQGCFKSNQVFLH